MRALTSFASLSFGLQCFAAPPGYKLLWADEFSGTSLLTSKWKYDIGSACDAPVQCGWGNQELEYYSKDNAIVANGVLSIVAKPQQINGASFTSARISTSGKASFTYGYVEASISLPSALGLWPAFWLLPSNSPYDTWASSGEIDVLERVNYDTHTSHTIQYGGKWPQNVFSTCSNPITVATAAAFNTYGLLWTPQNITWYINDQPICTKLRGTWNSAAAPDNLSAPFDTRFYILLNMAVGGYLTGQPSSSDIISDWAGTSPAMVVDYVRFYAQQKSGATSVPAALALPGTILAGSGYFDLTVKATAGNYLAGPVRSGDDLTSLVGRSSAIYRVQAAAGTYNVSYTLTSNIPANAQCMVADSAGATYLPVQLYLVAGSSCGDTTRYATLDLTGPQWGPSNGVVSTYASSDPFIFATSGVQNIALCIVQAPFVTVKSLQLVKTDAATLSAHPLQIPGKIYGASFGFDTFVDAYAGPCGMRQGKSIAEMSAGERYTFDVDVQAAGKYAVTYRMTVGNPSGVPVQIYVAKGAICDSTVTQYAPFSNVALYTGGYTNYADFAVTTSPVSFTKVGRQKVSMCLVQGSYMLLESMTFTKV